MKALTQNKIGKKKKEEMEVVRNEVGAEAFDKGRFKEAIGLFRTLSLAPDFEEFLTLPAYDEIVAQGM